MIAQGSRRGPPRGMLPSRRTKRWTRAPTSSAQSCWPRWRPTASRRSRASGRCCSPPRWLLGRLMRAVRAKLGYPDPSEVRGPRSPGHTAEDLAARLRHDSPGGWTAGETRWTLAHEHGWYTSRDYRTFLAVVIVVVLSWAFGIHFAHQFCP